MDRSNLGVGWFVEIPHMQAPARKYIVLDNCLDLSKPRCGGQEVCNRFIPIHTTVHGTMITFGM